LTFDVTETMRSEHREEMARHGLHELPESCTFAQRWLTSNLLVALYCQLLAASRQPMLLCTASNAAAPSTTLLISSGAFYISHAPQPEQISRRH
jgi:hypothetical protein